MPGGLWEEIGQTGGQETRRWSACGFTLKVRGSHGMVLSRDWYALSWFREMIMATV